MSNFPPYEPPAPPQSPPQYGEFAPPGYLPPPPQAPRRRILPGLIASGVIFVVLVAGAGVAFAQRQNIADLLTVWNYEPSSEIQGYIERAQLSDRGEFLFKASTPAILGTDDFNETCGTLEEGTGVLGCYVPRERAIYLFDVTDDRLDGVEEVVAAHEMLHAAWHRMGADERDAIGVLLEDAIESYADDEDFTERMAVYARTEPGERLNELHSIVGTELAELSPELEAYYTEFFDDREALVALHLKSDAVLTEIEDRTTALADELEKLNDEIEADYTKYNKGYDELNAAVDAFNAKNSNYGFSNQAQFDAERNALIDRQSKLDALFASIEKRSNTYEDKLAELAELNEQVASLNEGLNVVPRDSEI